ncbi:MAG: hypothetical protein LIP11_01515 [Clostridiales bacterium]|nr:hypothetical protein [Clostridiales bacterium]
MGPYYYLKYLLEELSLRKDVDGNIAPSDVDDLLPWPDSLPAECHEIHR